MPSDRDASRGGRARILDAAEHLFARRSFSATSMKAIADRAGLATGLLYYHFDSKDDLLVTLVAERSFAAGVDDVLANSSGEEPRVSLARIGHAFVAALDDSRDMARILLQDAAAGDSNDSLLQRILQSELDQVVNYLRHATTARKQRAELAARTLFTSLLVGTVVLPHPDRDQLVRGTVEATLAVLT